MNILFVCTGNTCRSPMAQGILEDMAKEKGLGIVVKSAGVYALDGSNASVNAIRALREDNIDISNHRASIVHRDLIEEADLILTMGKSHKDILVSKYGFAQDKIHILNEFIYGIEKDIIDPFGGSIQVYNNTKYELYNAMEELLKKLMRGEF
ncbi:MAG: low molecular weight protein arginine phosphatase [Tissierellia bacterium]|mgnify:CR=1 FL=1|nr:low molecular weight protein arginine phosphatase [Tissierellia bacterium]